MLHESRAESRSKENSGEMDRQDQGRSMGFNLAWHRRERTRSIDVESSEQT